MPEKTEWAERSVQGSRGSYRISVPKEWAENSKNEPHSTIWRRVAGSYLIARPPEIETGTEQPIIDSLVDFEKILEEEIFQLEGGTVEEKLILDFEERKINLLDVYVQNLLQSYYISGAQTLQIGKGLENIEKEYLSNEFKNAFEKAQKSPLVRWNRRKKELSIRRGVEYEEFVEIISDFIYYYMIEPLDENHSFKNIDSASLEAEEDRIDTFWALRSRESAADLFNLQRDEFPNDIGSLYIEKYLETASDIVERFYRIMVQIESEFDDDFVKKVNNAVLDTISYGKNAPTWKIDELIEDVSKFSLDPENHTSERINISNDSDSGDPDTHPLVVNFLHETFAYFERVDKLEKWRREKYVELMDPLESIESREKLIQAGMMLGHVFALVERLVRIPRSIAQAGLGIELIERVHDLGEPASGDQP